MAQSKTKVLSHVHLLVSGLTAWLLSACVLLILAAWLVTGGLVSNRALGYLSSAISFSAAIFAGARIKRCGGRGVGVILPAGFALILCLLTIGFLIGRGTPDPSGVLSVVTFTLSGFLAGNILAKEGDPGTHRLHHTIKRKKRS